MNKIVFEPWYGELGWEIMTWAPVLRKKAADYGHVTVSSFIGMNALYADFADKFIPHDGSRSLDYPKMYRHDGIYYRYGDPLRASYARDILIHARGVSRKRSINYRSWPQVAKMISGMGLTVAFIGGQDDYSARGYMDFRGIELQQLMDRIAASKLVIGVSSGVMHLAAACGTDIVVWGDNRTYFGETLEQRYKVTWNPFEVRVGWIRADDWQPEPGRIIDKIKLMLHRTDRDLPLRDEMRKAI